MKDFLKRMGVLSLAAVTAFSLAACSGSSTETEETSGSGNGEPAGEVTTYKIGICNYVDDASLNQIVDNIKTQLDVIAEEENVKFEIDYQNCNADSNVLAQIIDDFIVDEVDLMVGVATPVAMQMQAKTEDTDIPVVFAAVSDPVGAGLVESNEEPGANITGTSDYLNTNAIMDLIIAQDPDIDTIGLLYDTSQDSSTTAIANAKAYLDEKGIKYIEKNGTNTSEIQLAADALVADGVKAVFTPSDNTVMNAELAIYETFAEAGVLHYGGADSFALNGAFLGFGVEYANLGIETANMIKEILIDGADVATLPVKTFDNGIATINTDICEQVGLDFDELSKIFEPYCTRIESIVTAESFDDIEE